MPTDGLIERLEATRWGGIGLKGVSIGRPLNPDGPEAAALIKELERRNALMCQAVDSAIIQMLETQTHGGLTEYGEGGLAKLKRLEAEFERINAKVSLSTSSR